MKVILINPDSSIIKSLDKIRRTMSLILPSGGIAYIGAILEKNGIDVKVIDQAGENSEIQAVLKIIEQESPEVVGFSCLIHNMDTVKKIITGIKESKKRVKIVLGNIYATIFADELLKDGIGDIIVRGEGEYSMLEAVLTLKRGESLRDVKGISFVENETICHNPDRDVVEDLDELPYPAWHLFDLDCYRANPLVFFKDIALPIQASRGCSYRCFFCSQDKIYKRPRYRKVKNVIDEIEFMLNKFKINDFIFTDAYFPFSVDYGLEFCDEITRRGLRGKIRWHIETRVDKVNLKLLKRMKEAGLYLILYGFESGNQGVLDSLNKETTLEQARNAIADTKKAGIFTHGLFVLGMPGETRKTCEETIRFARELDPDIAKFNIAMPFPGSKFFDDYKDKLGYALKKLDRFDSWYNWASQSGELVYTPDGMSSKDLIGLQRKAMFQFYMRPRLIMRHMIKRRIPFKNLLFGFYVLLADYLKTTFDRFAFRSKYLNNQDDKIIKEEAE